MLDYLIDTHCHLHDTEWFTPEQAEDFLREAYDNNVREVIVIGTDPDDSANARKFAASHDNVYWTYGIHPEFADKWQGGNDTFEPALHDQPFLSESWTSEPQADAGRDQRAERVGPESITLMKKEMADHAIQANDVSRLVAIGEIGLDYHYDGYNRDAQIHLFEHMLQLAQDLDLPVSLHIREREAFADVWPILDNFLSVKGVVHSFTGSKQELRRALERDFYIGVNGLATYSTLPLPPLEKMLLETDAPFLTPVPFRGTINKPGYVSNIATYLAGKLGVAEVNLVEQTTKNARQLFRLRDPIIRPGEGV